MSPRRKDLAENKILQISVTDSFKNSVGHESLIMQGSSSVWARRQRSHLALVVLGLFVLIICEFEKPNS